MKKRLAIYLFGIFLFLICTLPGAAQVHIAPITLNLDANNRTGRYVVHNNSASEIEVRVELIFGYPDTDSTGNVYFKQFENVPENEPSALDWVRPYPRHVVLQPGERQTIRLNARPPTNLASGEYWVRPVLITQEPMNLNEIPTQEHLNAQLNVQRRTVLSLNYNHGRVFTGIDVTDMTALRIQDEITLTADFSRLGNAAYRGHAIIKLINSKGREVYKHQHELAVYKDQKRRITFSPGNLPLDNYTAVLELTTSLRKSEGVIQAPKVTKSVDVLSR